MSVLPVDGDPPELDARGVVVITDEVRARLAHLGVVAGEPSGSVRPCGTSAHQPKWYRRPWPMGDLTCDVCHPSIEMLHAEGYPGAKRNHVPERYVGRHITKGRPKSDKATSDLAGHVDSRDLLFGEDV